MIDRYYVRYASEYLEHDNENGNVVMYEDHLVEIEKYKLLAEAAWEVGYATARAVYERKSDD